MYIYTSLRASRAGAIRGPRTVLAVGGPLARACFLVCGALYPTQLKILLTVVSAP